MTNVPMAFTRTDPTDLDYGDRARLAITDDDAVIIALSLLRRTKRMITAGLYGDESVVHVYRRFIEHKHRERRAMIAYLEGELIDAPLPTGYTGYFVLRWNSNLESFVLHAAPSE